ncbi:MAG: phosphoglycolate phosphatase [Pseudomonadota bacterium]
MSNATTPMAAMVFDLDGTLIDSAPDIHAAVNRLLAEERRPTLDLSTIISFVGNGLPHLVDLVMKARDLPTNQHADLTQRTLDHYNAMNGTLTRVFPGVEQALNTLMERGHPMAICTNKPEAPASHILEHLGLDRYVQAVIGGDSLPVRKPDPAPLHAAFAALGAATGLYVGDSEVDAETAERAGVPFLLFTEGYRKSPVV